MVGGGSDLLNSGKILLVCAATSLKQGIVRPKTGDYPQSGGAAAAALITPRLIFR